MKGFVVGADRLRAVTRLTSTWDAAVDGGPCRLVLVRGASGSGRSTMLRALYRHAAMRQPWPPYWPADLTDSTPTAGATSRGSGVAVRDLLFPERLQPAAGSRLEHFWWGLRGVAGSSAAIEGAAQVKAHLQGLAAAIADADRQTKARLQLALEAGLLIGSFLPLTQLLQTAINIAGAAVDAPDYAGRRRSFGPDR